MKRKHLISSVLFLFVLVPATLGQNMTVYRSDASVAQTTEVLLKTIKAKQLRYFETVAHHEIAAERSAEVSPTNVIIFEDAELSTKLITCEQTSALDLPLKIMIWEEHGDVYIGYFDPILMRRKFLIDGCDEVLKAMSGMMARLVNESLRDL